MDIIFKNYKLSGKLHLIVYNGIDYTKFNLLQILVR